MDKMNIMMNVSKKWKGTTGIVYLENVESQGSMKHAIYHNNLLTIL